MGLDTRLSLRTIAEPPERASSAEPVDADAAGKTPSRNIGWHLLGIVFAAWAVLFWMEQLPASDRSNADAGVTLPEAIVGTWSCWSDDGEGQTSSTRLQFGSEGSFERRSSDVGSLEGDYAARSHWIDVSLTRLPALEKYGMDPSINQKMRLNMTDYSKRRLVFDSEITTNGLGSRRWTCGRG